MNIQNIIVDSRIVGKRVDRFFYSFVLEYLDSKGEYKSSSFSREFISALISADLITINGKEPRNGKKLKLNDQIRLDTDLLEIRIKEKILFDQNASLIIAEIGELNIVYECDDYMVIDKERGVVVHPGANNRSGTVANFIKGYLDRKGIFDPMVERAGIVHRLDKGVGGLMIVAKNRTSQLYFKSLFESRKVLKVYTADVNQLGDTKFSSDIKRVFRARKMLTLETGTKVEIKEEEIFNKLLDSFKSDVGLSEEWKRVEGYIGRDLRHRNRMNFFTKSELSLLENRSGKYRDAISNLFPVKEGRFIIYIETGRMHQIRATLRALGYVIVGDKLYLNGHQDPHPKLELYSSLIAFTQSDGVFKSFSRVS